MKTTERQRKLEKELITYLRLYNELKRREGAARVTASLRAEIETMVEEILNL